MLSCVGRSNLTFYRRWLNQLEVADLILVVLCPVCSPVSRFRNGLWDLSNGQREQKVDHSDGKTSALGNVTCLVSTRIVLANHEKNIV